MLTTGHADNILLDAAHAIVARERGVDRLEAGDAHEWCCLHHLGAPVL
jgi:hypothetical protein